jgi:hypothetical protein
MRLPWPLPDSSFRRFRLLNSYAAAKKVSKESGLATASL